MTRDEVYDILRQAEDNGFVHQITNIDGENKIFAICNCNVNICNALRTSQLFNTPNSPAPRTLPRWTRRSVWPAVVVWSIAPPVR